DQRQNGMQAAFASFVGMPAVRKNSQKPSETRKKQQRGYGRNGKFGHALHKRRNPVRIGQEACGGAKPREGQEKNTRLGEGLQDGIVADSFLGLQIGRQFGVEPITFVGREPARIRGPVGEKEKRDDAKNNRGNSFQDEEPAPSGKLQPMDPKQSASKWGAKQRRSRNGRVEPRDGAAAPLLAKPIRPLAN